MQWKWEERTTQLYAADKTKQTYKYSYNKHFNKVCGTLSLARAVFNTERALYDVYCDEHVKREHNFCAIKRVFHYFYHTTFVFSQVSLLVLPAHHNIWGTLETDRQQNTKTADGYIVLRHAIWISKDRQWMGR
jgi:hypothetical protein